MSAVPLVLKLTTQRTSHPQHGQVAEGTRDPSLKWKGKFTGSNPVLTTKNKRMKKQFVKDLPIYLNGFAVGMLFFRSGVSSTNVVAYALAMITFFWYGKINK